MDENRKGYWCYCPLPEGCRYFVLTEDVEVFDKLVERCGVKSLYDHRHGVMEPYLPVFIGWSEEEVDPSGLDT